MMPEAIVYDGGSLFPILSIANSARIMSASTVAALVQVECRVVASPAAIALIGIASARRGGLDPHGHRPGAARLNIERHHRIGNADGSGTGGSTGDGQGD